jgi:hypothetical protein
VRTIKEGGESRVVYGEEIAIQAIVQRTAADRSAVRGRLDFRVVGTLF